MPGSEATDKYIRNVAKIAKFATMNGNPMLIDNMDEDHPLFWLPHFEVKELLIRGVKIGAPRHNKMMIVILQCKIDPDARMYCNLQYEIHPDARTKCNLQ